MSEVKVNKVSPRSGTTVTIGDSGDTINLVGTLQNNGSPLAGDISSVVAGTGLSGGATSGVATLNIEAAQPTITSLGTITSFRSTGIDDNADATAITIDSSERVGIGTTSPQQPLHIQSNSGVRVERFANSSGSANLDLRKSRNATIGSHAILQNGDGIGGIIFRGSDGTSFENAAAIAAQVDGTPGIDDMPARLTFSTTADGTNSYTERMRITSGGLVGIGTSSPSRDLVISNSGAEGYEFGPGESSDINQTLHYNRSSSAYIAHWQRASYHRFDTPTTEAMRLTSTGLGIGTASPSQPLDVVGSAQISFSSGVNTYQYFQSTSNFIGRKTDGNLNIGVAGSQSIVSSVGGSEKMRIDSSGSLGLGTTSPFNTRPGAFTISNEAPTIYMEDTNGSGSQVGQLLYQNAVLSYSIGSRSGTGTTNSTELLKINNAGKIFTRQTAQFDDCVTIGGAQFTGDFQIEVSGLTAVSGNAHKAFGIRLSYRGIAGDATNGQNKDALIYLAGLTSWSGVGGIDTGGGSLAITVDSATTTAVTFTVTSPASTCVGAYVATLFANDESTMECNG